MPKPRKMNLTLTVEEKKFYEVLEGVLKETGRTAKEYAEGVINSLGAVDFAFINALKERHGLDIAQELHEKKWKLFLQYMFESAKKDAGIEKIDDLSKLSLQIGHIHDLVPWPYKVVEQNSQVSTGVIIGCPLLVAGKELSEEEQTTFFKIIGTTHPRLIKYLIELAGLSDKVEGNMDKRRCQKEDTICRVILTLKERNSA